MRLRSIGILSVIGLLGLVLAAQAALAQGMTPGQAAPPLPTVDLTKPGSARIPPRPVAAVLPTAAPAPAMTPPVATKAPPSAAKAAPVKAKPRTVAKTVPGKKTTTKAPPKTAKGKPAPRPTQTAIVGDR